MRAPALPSWATNPYLHLALNATLVTVSELFLKAGARAAAAGATPRWLDWTGFPALGSGWVWAGIASYLLSFGNWLYILRLVPLHVAYPVTNLSHALIPLGAWIAFGERFGFGRALGIAFIIAGTWVVARPPERKDGLR